ncbi:MAG TPA: ribosomal RNA small subunit methyltransferase A [Elusimicrobia bacterium]|jgi:16S rRNA (adenine1518-N6/adenine1519-N6)-dimethyltransferase|nr:ribosomal RNA small subunit methyltransferase A [Elusimicrobiota bacterium]
MGKFWGQHFLIDKNIVRKIVQTADLHPRDVILEIGPGKGILTGEILPSVTKVIAIEIDRKLISQLKDKFALYFNRQQLEIINADFLKFDLDSLNCNQELKIVANIPYYITGAILEKIFDYQNWQNAVFLLQREVAERLIAQPGSKNYGILSIVAQVYCRIKIISFVSAKVFRPEPKVESAIVRFERLAVPLVGSEEEKSFFSLLHLAFGQRRKILLNNLARGLGCSKLKLQNIFSGLSWSLNLRAENLSITDFIKLNQILSIPGK